MSMQVEEDDVPDEVLERQLEKVHQLSSRAVGALGGLLVAREQFERATDLLQALIREVLQGQKRGGEHLGDTWFNLGIAYAGLSDIEEAIAAQQEALAFYKSAKDTENHLLAAANLAGCLLAVDSPNEALSVLEDPLTGELDQYEDQNIVGLGLAFRAQAQWSLSDLEDAVSSMRTALSRVDAQAKKYPQDSVEPDIRFAMASNLGAYLIEQEKYDEAIKELGTLLEAVQTISDEEAALNFFLNLSYAQAMAGNLQESMAMTRNATALARRTGDLDLEAQLLEQQGALLFRQHDFENAIFYFQQALKFFLARGRESDAERAKAKLQESWDVATELQKLRNEEQRVLEQGEFPANVQRGESASTTADRHNASVPAGNGGASADSASDAP